MIWQLIFYTELTIALAGIPILFFSGIGWAMLAGGSYLMFLTWGKFAKEDSGKNLRKLASQLEHIGTYTEISDTTKFSAAFDRKQKELEDLGFEVIGNVCSGLSKPIKRRILVHRRQQIWAELRPHWGRRCDCFFYSLWFDGTVFRYGQRKNYFSNNLPPKIMFKTFRKMDLAEIFKIMQQDNIHFSLTYPAAISMIQIPIRTLLDFLRELDFTEIRLKLYEYRFLAPSWNLEMLRSAGIFDGSAQKLLDMTSQEDDLPRYWAEPPPINRSAPELSEECKSLIQGYDRAKIPEFSYLPNAYRDGIIQKKSGICECCGETVEYTYTGGIYCVHEVSLLCPWCIAGGAAAMRYNGNFNEFSVPVSPEIDDAVAYRTPTISGWQQIPWEMCCDDAMIYMEAIETRKMFEKYRNDTAFTQALRDVEYNLGNFDETLETLPIKGPSSLLIHVFKCRHCGKYTLNFDAD